MTTEDVKTTVKSHRPAALIGGLVGLVLVLGYFGFDIVMTPTEPAIQTASASEVITYVINPRGLEKMADIEKEQFLNRWKEHLAKPEEKAEIKDALTRLSDEDRKSFTDVIFKQLKRSFMDEADRFSKLSTQAEKSEFCRKRVAEFAAEQSFMKEIAIVFKGDFPGPDKFQEWVLTHTSPAERQLGEPYVEALKRVATQIKREARATTTAKG
jgi:hypothetical protein